MSEQTRPETENLTRSRWWWWLLAGLVILLLIWLGLQFFAEIRPLKPVRETAVPPNITINGQHLLVDFDDLNESPTDYLNLRVRVSGNYLRLEPIACAPFSGPRIQWGLVAAGLQLNASGFEAVVLPIVPANTQMTLEGFWRRYPSPAGCGKEPTSGLWYLDVEQIVQPNPLVAGTVSPIGELPQTPQSFPGTVTVTPTLSGSLPPVGGTPVPNVTIVGTVVVETPVSGSTITATAVSSTATPTLTIQNGTATPTPSPQSGTPTAASPTATIDLTTTATPSSTPGRGTSAPTPTSNPQLVTATPGGGYPEPTTLAPSPTPDEYP
ncbi:MAG: hypothetical protein GY805_12760 [Chloroflexi bacterium]|nr:hypothetical protein [Chloroflexota bacterium]